MFLVSKSEIRLRASHAQTQTNETLGGGDKNDDDEDGDEANQEKVAVVGYTSSAKVTVAV